MKRGQVTLFIIIGIVMLLLVAFFIYVGTRERVEFEVKIPVVVAVSGEAKPVYDLVQSCIELKGKEALMLAGAKGGFIEQKFSYNRFEPTEGAAVLFSDGSDLVVPYWFYMSSPNDCTADCGFVENIPKLFEKDGKDSIESQLGRYVSDNLRSCVDFSVLEAQGYRIAELTRPVIKATITPDNVFFSGTYDLRVEKGGAVTELGEYYVPLDVKLYEVYRLAVDVAALQAHSTFLETSTREIISLFSGMDKGQLPPFSEFRISFGAPKYWLQFDAEHTLQRLLSGYLQLLRAGGTRNFDYALAGAGVRDPLLYETVFNRQFFLPLTDVYPDYDLRFSYLPWWDMFFDMNCNGQLCTADYADFPLAFLIGMQQYRFQYDVSYPVLVTLTDPDAFSGEGFTFQYFLEANLRNNNPLKGLDIMPSVNVGGDLSIFCNPDQFTSGEVEFTVRDAVSLKLADASVAFRCGSETCLIGETVEGVLKSSLPRCVGGIFIVQSEDYMQQAGLLDTVSGDGRSILVELLPKKELRVSASKFVLRKIGGEWRLNDLPESVDADEQVVVVLERVKQSSFDEDFVAFAELNSSGSVMELVPGDYHVRIDSIKYPERVVIPADRRCQEFGIWPFEEEVCYSLPEEPLVFDESSPLPYGHSEYDVTVSSDELRGASSIELRYVAFGLDDVAENDRVIEDLDKYGKLDDYAKSIKGKLRPVIR